MPSTEPDPEIYVPEPPPVRVTDVRVLSGSEERRNPVVLIELAIYDLRVTYAVVALKGGKLEFRPPETPERTGGVELPEHLEGAVHDTLWGAAMTDATAWALLTRRPSVRVR